MKRHVIAACLVAVVTSASYGDTYLWNPNKRPPVSLQRALQRAEELLGDEAKNRYCISVWLYGNKAQDGKQGVWRMVFAAEDGSKTRVWIDESGQGGVKHVNGPIDWRKKEGRRTGLQDIATRLNRILESHGYTERATLADRTLALNARCRNFRVHTRTESGEFSQELVEVTGPKVDGILIEASEINSSGRVARSCYEFGVFWHTYRDNHLLTGDNRLVKVDIRHGEQVSDALILSLMRAFGECEPGIF